MKNLCAKFGCHISSNNRDKQGWRNPPLQALSVSNHPGQIELSQICTMNCCEVSSSHWKQFFLETIKVDYLICCQLEPELRHAPPAAVFKKLLSIIRPPPHLQHLSLEFTIHRDHPVLLNSGLVASNSISTLSSIILGIP